MRHRTSSATIRRPATGVLPAILCATMVGAPTFAQPPGETTVLRAARILDACQRWPAPDPCRYLNILT